LIRSFEGEAMSAVIAGEYRIVVRRV